MTNEHQYIVRSGLLTLVFVLGLAPMCPDLVVASDRTVWGGPGGEYFREACPPGSYLVGLKGSAGSWVNRIAPICAPWLPAKLTFGAPTVGPFHGTSRGGVERERICWGFGINNRAIQSWTLKRLSSDNFIEYIKAHCTSLAPPTATARLNFGGPITEDQGGSDFADLGTQRPDYFSSACPTGELAVGIHVRAGEFLDAIGLICGPLPPNLVPPATNVNPLAMKPAAPATRVNPLAVAPRTAATSVNPLGAAPVPTDNMFTITRPAWNDRVQQGQLVVKATPPKVGATSVTVLELKWLDAPPGQSPFSTFAVETPKLLQGFPIDQRMTQGRPGRWEVRARISAQPTPGPWSFPVQFQLFQTQPVQSQQQAPPMMQQAPLPSSSVMQAPAPSSATTQMRRSPSMIIPRGVEEKGSTTPAEQHEPAKKP